MIKLPPTEPPANPLIALMQSGPEQLEQYLPFFTPLDGKGRYLPFDEFRHRISKKLDLNIAWALTKLARHNALQPLLPLGEPAQLCRFVLTPTLQAAISEVDRHTTTPALEWMCTTIGEARHLQYLLGDLIEDEAISSSQLEGAATTTLVAKDLLKRQRKPRTPDEKMILGNFRMMKFAWEQRSAPLSVALLEEMHQIGVSGIDDDKYRPGCLRDSDDVVVEDGEGQVVHQPPPAAGLAARLQQLADWANNEQHHSATSAGYLHPLVKAISLHFAIGYEHPFHDGNGRVARSLFYWYLFRHNFGAFRYIAISLLLKEAAVQYGKSYLYCESDGMDLTYFIDYQASIVARAVARFRQAYDQALAEIQQFDLWLRQSGLLRQLNANQRTILQVAHQGKARHFTAAAVSANLGCSYNTASSALNGLVELKLFSKEMVGREWVFTMLKRGDIVREWRG